MEKISKILKSFLSKRGSLLFIWGFITIVLFIIYVFFVRKPELIIPEELPEIKINLSDNREISLLSLPSIEIPNQLAIYEIDQDNQVRSPQTFFQQFSVENLPTTTLSDDGFYVQDSTGNSFSYFPDTESTLITVNNEATVKTIFDANGSSLTQFLKENDYYQDVDYTEKIVDDTTLLTGNLLIDKYSVEPRGILESTIELRFKDKSLTYFRANLVNFTKYKNYPTIPANTLNQYLSLRSYPKEVNYNIRGNYMALVEYPALLSSLSFKRVHVSSIEIVYLLIDKDSKYLVPVYKVKGISTGTLSDGTELNLDLLIYASAIDPDYLSVKVIEDTFEPHLIPE